MKLKELLIDLKNYKTEGNENVLVTGISYDSRKVKKGDLFVCWKGEKFDGHSFIPDAIERGAIAILCSDDIKVDVPVVIVDNPREAMSYVSNTFYGYPSNDFTLIGITGTNGKTTTTFMIEKILSDYNKSVGLMGNLGISINGELSHDGTDSQRNTQESPVTQSIFRKMKDRGVEYCVMEASSMGLSTGRLIGCDFDVAIFSNLTLDHLDDHGSFENYKAAKGLLFSGLKESGIAILNYDDPVSFEYEKLTSAKCIYYGINGGDIKAEDIRITSKGTSFDLIINNENMEFETNFVGRFNVYNALSAIACTISLEIPIDSIKKSFLELMPTPGRMETVDAGQDFQVIVDYAHTPDSLENVLKTLVEIKENKIITVFGCGGDRDNSKRPIMGDLACKYSDKVFITSDNPRTEDPLKILNDIEEGVKNKGYEDKYVIIEDRKKAIIDSIKIAEKGDIVLIAGKGHETYQILRDETIHFDDREVAREAINIR